MRDGAPRYEASFHTGGQDPERAQTFEVGLAAQVSVDIVLKRTRQTYRIRGRVLDSNGKPLPSRPVSLAFPQFVSGSASQGSQYDPATGEFAFEGVSPGTYIVQAHAPLPPSPDPRYEPSRLTLAELPSAYFRVQVVDRDVDGLVLLLGSGSVASGRVVVENPGALATPFINRIVLVFRDVVMTGIVNMLPMAEPSSKGGFRVVNLRGENIECPCKLFRRGIT
jgi:hypothetical protein